jgi:undecaprenyl-diphosphatase
MIDTHFSRFKKAGDIRAAIPIRVPPTSTDVAIANAIAARTGRPAERVAKTLTWGADEHILCALAGAWWIYCRNRDPDRRRASDHILLTTAVATALPHVLKTIFDQQRPDRTTVRGHWRGIPLSGKRLDSFPSGHAVHVGALASAATVLPEKQRNLVWSMGAGLVVTRIVLLAHWASDVAAGLAVGASIERLLRHLTGYSRERRRKPLGRFPA